MPDHRFQGSGLGEKMAGARDDFQRLRSLQTRECLLIQFDDAEIIAAYDQERGRANLIERGAREVRPPAA